MTAHAESHTHQFREALTFSIQGKLINDIAREKLYYNNDLPGAIALIMSCIETDELSEDTRRGIALDILDGRKELVGVYPGPDYGVADIPEERRPKQNLQSYTENLLKQLNELKQTNKLLTDKLICVAENMPEYAQINVDKDWRRNYWNQDDTSEGADTIFGSKPEPVVDSIFGSALVSSYLQRMTSTCDDPDYGWLFADGHFEPVEFGDHAKCKEHDRARLHFSEAGDYLQRVHRACLLHNPALGVAILTATGELTKAQKEFMYDYYIKRGMNDKANALYSDSTASNRSY